MIICNIPLDFILTHFTAIWLISDHLVWLPVVRSLQHYIA